MVRSALLQAALVCLLLLAAGNPVVAATVNATFEVRPAVGQDATIALGETLDLDVFLTLSSGTSFSNVKGISFFLYTDTHKLHFNPSSFANDSGLSGSPPMSGGVDNNPYEGDFDRTLWIPGGNPGVAFTSGVPTKVAHFSVTAPLTGSHGSVAYSFGALHSGQRPTAVSFKTTSDTPSYQPTIGLTITVTPEPGMSAGVLLGFGLLLRRRPHRGR